MLFIHSGAIVDVFVFHSLQGTDERSHSRQQSKECQEKMTTQVFVANINFQSTEQELAEYFSRAGRVRAVRIPKDRETGRPRGFAFVTFETEEQARQAVWSCDGESLGSRRLKVRLAEEQRGGRTERWKPRSVSDDSERDDEPDDIDSRGRFADAGHRREREWRQMRRTKRSL